MLRLNLFGSPELVRPGPAGAALRFRTRKHLAVLLYLHFEGRARAVPRDRLVDLIWPEVSASKGRHSLSQALLAIRTRLGKGAVTGKEQDVRLLAELPTDLSAFRDGDIAGFPVTEPLRGIEDCGGVEFAHWADGARARLRTEARDLLLIALRAARASGHAAHTHRLAAALHNVDQLCAEAVYALAEGALLDADTVGAMRLLKDHVRRARGELGADPNPEIVRLLRRLERGERPAVAPSATEVPARPHVFVARVGELGTLEALAQRVATETVRVCLITGAPGVGKSSLLRRFATSLQARAWSVFVVACQEIGQGIPYAAVAELITSLGRDPAAAATDPLWLSEASRVCPALRAIYAGVPEPVEAPTDSIRLRVAEAVIHMMAAVADEGPVLLVFDDMQFIDPASQDVLFLVTRGLAGQGGPQVPTLVLGGMRGGEATRGGVTWGEALALEPLDRAQALTLIHELSRGDDTSADIQETIVRLSQGNPYHIEMLLADWRMHRADSLVAAESAGDGMAISWAPPEDLRAAFARQFGDLSTDARHTLQVLAVAGKSMAPLDVATLLGLDGGATERVALEMLDRGVGRVDQGKLSFKNELHRAYVYHAMGSDRRTYHHTQLASRLSSGDDRGELQVKLELVHHSMGAGLERQAMDTALDAAEDAIARDAPREAERVLTRILRAYTVAPGSRLRLLLAHALFAESEYQRALDTLNDWQSSDPSPGDRALAALLRAEALHRARLGSDEIIMNATQDAIARAEEAGASRFLVRANYIRAEIGIDGDLGALADAEALAERIAARDPTPECVALANLTIAQVALTRGQVVQAVERLDAALPILQSLALLVELRRGQSVLGICLKALGRFDEAARAYQEAISLAERGGVSGAIVHTRMILANLYHDLAFYAAAVDCFRPAFAVLQAITSSRAWVEGYCDVARLAVVLGNLSEAEVAVERCEDGARRSSLWRHRVTACMARAEFHLCTGQSQRAWSLLEEARALTGDRAHLLPDAGRYERLQRHFVWATRGYDAVKALDRPAAHARYDLVDALEGRIFDEAVAHLAGDRRDAQALEEAVKKGLLGPVARVLASGVHHPGIPERQPGESTAQLVARVFPHPQRAVIPAAVGL